MKKFILYISMCLMVCLAAIGLSACSPRLRVPLNLKVDIVRQEITWAPVENKVRYRYEINGEESTTRTETVSIEDLPEGSYTVRVRAESNGQYRNSQWTDEISFIKEAEDGLAHRLINGGTAFEVTGVGKVSSTNIVIDPVFRGLPVTRIADSAFANTGRVATIEIPESVKEIGARAFYNCAALANIVIPESVTSIGNYAFQRCRELTSVTLPSTLPAINDYTFANCSKLTSVNIGSSVKTIGRYAFSDCQELDSINIPDNVETVGEFAFYHCISVIDATVGNGVTVIGKSAFGGCTAMTTLKLGSALKSIEERAFADCSSLVNVDLGTGVETIGVFAFMNDTALTKLVIPNNVKTISQGAFAICSNLNEVSIGAGVEYVAYQAFAETKLYNDQLSKGEDLIYIDTWLVGNSNFDLTDVSIKEDTLGIAQYALYGSNAIVGLRIPDQVQYINDNACIQMTALSTLNIGESVKTIGTAAFGNCAVLTTLKLGNSLESIGENAFANAVMLNTITFGTLGNLKTIGRYAFSGCTALTSLSLPEGLETIGVSAFRNCKALRSVHLPNSLQAIETQAFANSGMFDTLENDTVDFDTGVVYAGDVNNNGDLWVVGFLDEVSSSSYRQITLKPNTVGIANYAFNKSETLQSIEIPNSVKEIGYAAFYKCEKLESVILPDDLKEIPEFCFYQCTVLKELGNHLSDHTEGLLDIPNTIETIGRSAFYKCSSEGMVAGSSTGFDSVYIPSSVKTIGDNAFLADSGIFNLTFELEGAQLTSIGDKTFNGCNNLVEITLPDSIETIGAYCFEKCYDLVTVHLGGVKEIGSYAFSQCYALTTMHIPDSTVTIKDHAFYWCEVLEDLTLGSGLETIEHHAFYANLALKSLALPANLKTIEMQAFRHCQGLESLVVSKDVDTIGNHVFYDCRALTIYTDASETPEGWAKLWNSSFRPIIYNCTLSTEGDYVVSFVKSAENSSLIVNDRIAYSIPLGNPYRAGFKFLGWTTGRTPDPEFDGACVMNGTNPPKAVDENGNTLDEPAFIAGAPIGSTIYAVWEAI